jgi:hypothetical protein
MVHLVNIALLVILVTCHEVHTQRLANIMVEHISILTLPVSKKLSSILMSWFLIVMVAAGIADISRLS